MTSTEFAAYIRDLTRTNSTTLPDAEILRLANVKRIEIAKRIESVDEGHFGAILEVDLVSSATSREYSFENVVMNRVESVKAKLDGVKFVWLDRIYKKQFDPMVNPLPISEDEIVAMFGNENGRAKYMVIRGSLFLYTGDISGDAVEEENKGLVIEAPIYPSKLTVLNGSTNLSIPASSTETAIPELFHDLWAEDVSRTWKQNKDAKVKLSDREANWEFNMRTALDSLVPVDRDGEMQQPVPEDTVIGDGSNI